jgi:outer membrane protein TolC
VEAGKKTVQEAKSDYFPQLDIGAQARMIDQDRAEVSFGTNPERLGVANANFTQLIYSEQQNANVRIQKHQQEAIESGRDVTNIDVIREAAVTYLQLLQAKTVQRIQQENLTLTRKNLELARIRQTVGYSGPSDLYRWESEIAAVKIELNDAEAMRKTAEINLNRVLNRPLQEEFLTEEADLEDPNLISNDPRIQQYIDNPKVLATYTDFMVQEGEQNLPEIRQVDALIHAQKRFATFNKRSFYLPNVGIDAGMDYLFYRGGAGSEAPDFGGGGPVLSQPNNLQWVIGVGASLPLITGGRRNASYQKSNIELNKLEMEKSRLLLQLEQLIRSNMQFVGASYANIRLSREAEEASRKNFELVQDSYSKGSVNIIQLIDAQNAAIQARLFAANAGYTFMIDLLNVERSIGLFYSLLSLEDRTAYFKRLDEFVQSNL